MAMINTDIISPDPATARRQRFLMLLEPVHDNLARFVRGMTRDREEARDVVAETILIALERIDTLRDDRSFLGFLFTIATRLCRRSRRRAVLFGAFVAHDAARAVSAAAHDERSDVDALYAALDKLPARQREAVVLFEISGLALDEIRVIQGGSLSGVKSRVTRGRRALATLLGVEDGAARRSSPARRAAPSSQAADCMMPQPLIARRNDE